MATIKISKQKWKKPYGFMKHKKELIRPNYE